MVGYKALNTVSECSFADRSDGVWNHHRCQTVAAKECIVADSGDGVPDAYRSQAAAAPECPFAN